jgi:hypothetical protein
MHPLDFEKIFNKDVLRRLFSPDRTTLFFEALLGNDEEGAFDIELVYTGCKQGRLNFQFQLKQRPGKCIACSLTYGLPTVFRRHPIINIDGLLQDINDLLDNKARCIRWQLGSTQEINGEVHVIPLTVFLEI